MTTAPHRLRAVRAPRDGTSRCTVVCQATLSGAQEVTVRVLTPVSGPGGPQIGVRMGPILILMSDREALESMLQALRQAKQLAHSTFTAQDL